MKKAGLLFLLLTLMPTQADSPSDVPPEFYFTRLMYSGGRLFGGSIERQCDTLAAGEGGRGGGGAWATDYPASDCKFMWGVERLTGVRVYKDSPHSVSIMDEELFKFPYIYAVEVGRGLDLTTEEAARLREYMYRGGFLHMDDFWGLRERDNFMYQVTQIFPDRKIEAIPLTHEVFHAFFDVDRVVQIPNVSTGCDGGPTWERGDDRDPVIYGVKDDNGRLMMIATYNSDLGDAWEWMDLPCYPEIYSGQAYRMGINFIIYAMTH
jgi:hypothetical protein